MKRAISKTNVCELAKYFHSFNIVLFLLEGMKVSRDLCRQKKSPVMNKRKAKRPFSQNKSWLGILVLELFSFSLNRSLFFFLLYQENWFLPNSSQAFLLVLFIRKKFFFCCLTDSVEGKNFHLFKFNLLEFFVLWYYFVWVKLNPISKGNWFCEEEFQVFLQAK